MFSSSYICFFVLCCTLFINSIICDSHDHETTCTQGRLFISDATTSSIHIYDLDTNMTLVRTINVVAPAMTLYTTQTEASKVIAIFGGNLSFGNNTVGYHLFFLLFCYYS